MGAWRAPRHGRSGAAVRERQAHAQADGQAGRHAANRVPQPPAHLAHAHEVGLRQRRENGVQQLLVQVRQCGAAGGGSRGCRVPRTRRLHRRGVAVRGGARRQWGRSGEEE